MTTKTAPDVPTIIDAIREAFPTARALILAGGIEDAMLDGALFESAPAARQKSTELDALIEQHVADSAIANRLLRLHWEARSALLKDTFPLGIAVGLLLSPAFLDTDKPRRGAR